MFMGKPGKRNPPAVCACATTKLCATQAQPQISSELHDLTARLIDHVASAGRALGVLNALALCMRAGIGITWIDAKGSAVGSIYPQQRTPTPLSTALELWAESPNGPASYQNWLRARRMNVLMRWGQERSATDPNAISPQQWESTKPGGEFLS